MSAYSTNHPSERPGAQILCAEVREERMMRESAARIADSGAVHCGTSRCFVPLSKVHLAFRGQNGNPADVCC
jgi:hypothetical protein